VNQQTLASCAKLCYDDANCFYYMHKTFDADSNTSAYCLTKGAGSIDGCTKNMDNSRWTLGRKYDAYHQFITQLCF
jgi:hypothetical protein